MKLKLALLLTFVLAVFALAPVATAAPLTVSFQGGTFGLEQLACSGCDPDQYLIRYSADLTSFYSVGNPDTYISAIAFKAGGDPSAAAVTAWWVDGSSVSPNGWNPVIVDKWMSSSAYGCGGSNGRNAICADAIPYSLAPTAGHIYYWDFLLTMSGTPDLASQPIRAQFANANGDYTGNLMSLTTPSNPVPEPASMLLLGTGLFGLGVFGRRKK